jgi:hypothetical protein
MFHVTLQGSLMPILVLEEEVYVWYRHDVILSRGKKSDRQ